MHACICMHACMHECMYKKTCMQLLIIRHYLRAYDQVGVHLNVAERLFRGGGGLYSKVYGINIYI